MKLERSSTSEKMMQMPTRMAVAAIATLSLFIAACGSDGDAENTPAEEAPTAEPEESSEAPDGEAPDEPDEAPDGSDADGEGSGVLALQVPIANEFTQCMATGFIDTAEAAGYDVVLAQGNFDDNDVLADFDRLIAEDVEGIVVLPTSDQSASQGTLAADRAGIPVVSAGWFSETDADDAYAGRLKVDVESGAEMIAGWIGENTEPADVVFVSGAPGLPTNDAFEEALGPAIDALNGDWELVGVEPGFYTREGAITAIENLTTAHPDAKIIVSLSADMGDGVATFLETRGIDDVVHVTGDSNLALVDNMEAGWIDAVLYWGPAEQAILATDLLLEFLSTGTKSEEITPIPISIETLDSISATIESRPICFEELFDQAEDMS